MNALTSIAAAPFDLNEAHMQAHKWVDIARPLIKAYLALDQIHGDVLSASHDAGIYGSMLKISGDHIGKAVGKLWDDIEDLRDAILADLSPPAPNWGRPMHECSPEVIDYDDLCGMWQERLRDVLSVDAAIDWEARG